MAAAARATLIGRDDAHFRDLLARLPAHLVAPPDLDEAAAEKFYKNKGQKAPEAERRAADEARRAHIQLWGYEAREPPTEQRQLDPEATLQAIGQLRGGMLQRQQLLIK